MSSSRPITECFKMKKPRPSPAKDATAKQCRATPKRRAPKKKNTPSKTPEPKPHCRDDASQENRESEVSELSTCDPDLWLCSQDVPVSDIGWDYSSPRNKVLKAKEKGGSDVAGLVGLFRHNPAETRPGVWDIIGSGFGGPSTTSPRKPRGKTRQKRAEDAPNRKVLFERMQGLLQLIEDNKNGESHSCVVEPVEREVVEETLVVRIGAENPAKICTDGPSEGVDDVDWADGDDSILVAATQEAEMAASPLRPKKPEARAKCASPLTQNAKRKSPGLRKSPRLLSMNKKSSPRGPSSAVTSATPETAVDPVTPVKTSSRSENVNGSFKDVMDNLLADDEDDVLLDWICSSYEQAQRLARAKPVPAKSSASASPRNAHPSRVTASRCSPVKVVPNKVPVVPKAQQMTKRPGERGSDVQRMEPKASGQTASVQPQSAEGEGTEWDDDDEFTTPEVVSWLEKIESQTSQRCTPQEIERKRREALLRRQQRSQQQWKGRLRTPK